LRRAGKPMTDEAVSPVRDDEPEKLEEGVALCLSGGGYRAMLFHVGALWRLNQLGYLSKLNRVSSVSGGSITAGVLGKNWQSLKFSGGVASNLDDLLVQPLRNLAGTTIDKGAVFGGIFSRATIAEKVAGAYRKHLFGEATLQALPSDPPGPRFVINATNVQTGSLWRFSKPYMADHQVGLFPDPDVDLATAVAASSAFPPVLSPVRIEVDGSKLSPDRRGAFAVPPYTTHVVLSDGGVYDNLGLETAWKRHKTILVSDGGGHIAPEPSPHHDWLRHGLRINGIIDNQVRNLRKKQVVGGYLRGERSGAYWGIRSHLPDYGPPPDSLQCSAAGTQALAQTKTRLEAMEDVLQERLINWGYAICDAAMRRWVDSNLPAPPAFPYPTARVG
jgi:NTE family protein